MYTSKYTVVFLFYYLRQYKRDNLSITLNVLALCAQSALIWVLPSSGMVRLSQSVNGAGLNSLQLDQTVSSTFSSAWTPVKQWYLPARRAGRSQDTLVLSWPVYLSTKQARLPQWTNGCRRREATRLVTVTSQLNMPEMTLLHDWLTWSHGLERQ